MFVVVSRQPLIDSRYSTVICAPVYSKHDNLKTQVEIGIEAGLKHPSSIHCDDLVSIPKTSLTDFIGSLSLSNLHQLAEALRIALAVEE